MNNWKHAAEQGAARVLAKNPNLLIMVIQKKDITGNHHLKIGELEKNFIMADGGEETSMELEITQLI